MKPPVKNIMLLLFLLCTACRQEPGKQTAIASQKVADTSKQADGPAHNASAYGAANEVTGLPQHLMQFVPAGYTVLDTASGNLNLDAHTDMILVLKRNGEDTVSDMTYDAPVKRPLLILAGEGNNTYKLAARNDNAVLCYACSGMFGDAFTGITVKNGYFSIEHGIAGGQHWESVTTFKYNKEKADWYLYKEGYVSYRMNNDTSADAEALVTDVEQQKTAKDFGLVPFEKYDTYKD